MLRKSSPRSPRNVLPSPLGHDTKVFMNSTQAPSKRSKIELIVDKVLLSTLYVQMLYISAVPPVFL